MIFFEIEFLFGVGKFNCICVSICNYIIRRKKYNNMNMVGELRVVMDLICILKWFFKNFIIILSRKKF